MRTQWIKANPEEPIEIHECEVGFFFENNARKEVNKFLGGELEFVSVMYNKKHAFMLTNEIGALNGMPVNARATDIYHTAVVKPKCEFEGRLYIPGEYGQIHGDVILVEEQMR